MPSYYIHGQILKKRRRKRRRIALILFIASLSLLLLAVREIQKPKYEAINDPLVELVKETVSPIHAIAEKDLEIGRNNYAIVIKNLKTGETFNYKENDKFFSASLYKIWVMATAYQRISEGKMSEDEGLSGNKEDLNITLEVASKEPSPSPKSEEEIKKNQISYRLGDAIERMITVSDNYAAILVSSRAGQRNVSTFLKDYELENSTYTQPPITTAKDTADLLEKIYKGEVIDKEYSKKMIDVLKDQQINDRLPKYLPESVQVAHKTGELGEYKHDGGIVFAKKGDYIIVVLSKTKNPSIASENIARFSEDIYKYFESN